MPAFTQLSERDRAQMLAAIGAPNIQALFADVPEAVRFPSLDLPSAWTEMEASRELARIAGENVSVRDWPCFIGAGAYNHYSPAAVAHLMGLPQFYTAYTPYQPEVSQGTLQAMFEFQSLTCELLGMDVANGSVYDGASGTGEAVLMAQRITGKDRVVFSGSVHPHWRAVAQTYVSGRGLETVTSEVRQNGESGLVESPALDLVDNNTACLVVQQPDYFGRIQDFVDLADQLHARGALLVVAIAEASSLGVLRPPGEYGADVAVAEGQALGLPLQYGGPWAGLMACRQEHLRQLPGRIAGQTSDASGRRGFVLTLQAREQHIRREKATSNICTSQTLLAIGIAAYLSLLGPAGLAEVARQSHARAVYAAEAIARLDGFRLLTPEPFYNEFLVECPRPAEEVRSRLLDRRLLAGVSAGRDYPGFDRGLLLAFTEQNSKADIDELIAGLASVVS
ncbi:MAG: aminomethyl-transferring glycine dehydrogenase subunit GcvPA [Chloroflexi bacterium]|nr:aminomethyl-transferring glycine dehydrogenase subunit GcvPA [Chloroflexota bacterium]